MCDKSKCCEKPDQLKSTSQECTAEQVKMCHGDAKVHPCVPTAGCHGETEDPSGEREQE